MAMDAKDLRIDSAITATLSDGNATYDQSNTALQSIKNKSYQDIGSNSLGKVEAQGARPCAIIGPDRVLPPPTASDAYLKKASVESWPCTDNIYPPSTDYPHKLPDYQSMRNISPRQTFQENMQRIMVPPSYSTKNVEDNLKSSKVDMPLEVKYCDVPYSINPSGNNPKSMRSSDIPIAGGNPPHARGLQPHGWTGVRPQRPCAPEFYQYPEFPNYSGPRPMQRIHRPTFEDPAQMHSERLYQEANARFKPYPTAKERFPQHRYDYISNFPNTYHPQPPFPPPKYDVGKTMPSHPYPMYPQVPIRRMAEPILDPYQRPNQQNFNPYQHQHIPPYGPVPGNYLHNKIYPYPPEMSTKTLASSKLPYDINTKLYVDYENVRNKIYPAVDNMPYYNDLNRQSSLKGDIALSMHHIPQHHIYRKDSMPLPLYYRGIDPSLYINNTLPRHPLQFSPSTMSKSPADSNTSNDAIQSTGALQEDCGYVSQSSTASGRSIDSGNYRIQNEIYRKNNNLYSSNIKNMSKHFSRSNSSNSSDKKNLNVRQFLQMWNEGEDDVLENNNSSTTSNMFSSQSETINNPEQLVVLGLVNIPNEELSKYEHIQKISKLPENIKGYNSIELLDQYEQLVETPVLRHSKKTVVHEYQFSPKSLAKQSSQLPRPISPLDVEAKISQSVIHKEVGCNFEIKPCSPKMLNVEVATPVQNMMDERTIEKVINTVMSNSPLLPNRNENITINSPSSSCKMNSPYISNNDLMKKNNYTLQDLESNSGVCLASLPRLDSDIELNFPEINQQFIDANRFNTNSHNEHLNTSMNNSLRIQHDLNKGLCDRNKTPETNTFVETAKLSKYRKIKTSDSLPENTLNNAVNSRTDSVIIKNPDNIRNKEEIVPNITVVRPMEKPNIVPNKDLNNISVMTIESDNLEDFNTNAIDFSLNKITPNISDCPEVSNFSKNEGSDVCISTDELQSSALSLVTRKVEMELREFESNECDLDGMEKANDSGLSLSLPYEDTINESFQHIESNDNVLNSDEDYKDNNSNEISRNNKLNRFVNIDDLVPSNSELNLHQDTELKSDSPHREDSIKGEIEVPVLNEEIIKVEETVFNKNIEEDIRNNPPSNINEKIEDFCENISTVLTSGNDNGGVSEDRENVLLSLESILSSNNNKECENATEIVFCKNKIKADERCQDGDSVITEQNSKNNANETFVLKELENTESNMTCTLNTLDEENIEEDCTSVSNRRNENDDYNGIKECKEHNEFILEKYSMLNKDENKDEESIITNKKIFCENDESELCVYKRMNISDSEHIVTESKTIFIDARTAPEQENTFKTMETNEGDIGKKLFKENVEVENNTKEECENIEIPALLPSQQLDTKINLSQTFGESLNFALPVITENTPTVQIKTVEVTESTDLKEITKENIFSTSLQTETNLCNPDGKIEEILEMSNTSTESSHEKFCNSEDHLEIISAKVNNTVDFVLNDGDNIFLDTQSSKDLIKENDEYPVFNHYLQEITSDIIAVQNKCLNKEHFSPWMQNLLLFTEGNCHPVLCEHKEDNDVICTDVKEDVTKEDYGYSEVDIDRGNTEKVKDKLEILEPSPNFNSDTNSMDNEQSLLDENIRIAPDTSEESEIDVTTQSTNVPEMFNEDEDPPTIILNNKIREDNKNHYLFSNQRVNLKRCLSDSALHIYNDQATSDNLISNVLPSKRRKLITDDFIESNVSQEVFCDLIQNNRRKSISAICNSENVFILIDDSEYIIEHEDDGSDKVCYTEDTSEFYEQSNNLLNSCVAHESEESLCLDNTLSNTVDVQTTENKIQESWVTGEDCIDNIFNDDVAVDITISAPLSPENSNISIYDGSICSDNENEHIDKIKEIYGDNVCMNDSQIVETLYKIPQKDVNKTLVDIESYNLQKHSVINASSNNCLKEESPNHFSLIPESISCNCDFEKSYNKENKDDVHTSQLSDIILSDNIKICTEDSHLVDYQECEDNYVDSCELPNSCTSITNSKYSVSNSPEVSSTTSEDKSSDIWLNRTNLNNLTRSENNISEKIEQARYKFTEKNDYTTNYRPLITKAAQKYIPPLIEFQDLKIKLPLPQQSLNKLKQLKMAQKEVIIDKSKHNNIQGRQNVMKKVKPKFEDVLKSIDEIQFKMHREKSKKSKTIPKVVIKKNENGAHYASTTIKKRSFNPDLTGRKWQPWVFIERNEFVDRMAQRNKRKAVYCHRKKTFVLEEKFKKYKSICTAKFVISQPTSDSASSGNLKYTIRLKHNY